MVTVNWIPDAPSDNNRVRITDLTPIKSVFRWRTDTYLYLGKPLGPHHHCLNLREDYIVFVDDDERVQIVGEMNSINVHTAMKSF